MFLSAFIKDYLFRRAFLDGWRGFIVAQTAATYAVYKRMRYYEMCRNPDSVDHGRRPAATATDWTADPMPKHYLLYGSERYALAILRPLQAAIRARGDEAAWFFDGPGGEDLVEGERWLRTTEEVRAFAPRAVLTPSNAVPHFFPGVKAEIFHGFDAGKPRHIYIRGFFDLYCTTGPNDTAAFGDMADKLGHFSVAQTGWPKLDPFADVFQPDATQRRCARRR